MPSTTPASTPPSPHAPRARGGFAGSSPIWSTTGTLLRGAVHLVRAGGVRLIGLILITQIAIFAVAFPVIGWLYREALRSSGMHGLDLGQLHLGRGLPLTFALIAAVVFVSFVLIVLQFTALIVLLTSPRIGLRAYLVRLGATARKLIRPGSLPLVGYLFLVLPLSGFGFASSLTQGIAVPSFISGELAKQVSTDIAFTLVLAGLALLNLRLALTVPAFVLTDERPARLSFALTRGLRSSVPLALAVTAITLVASLLAFSLLITAVVPTAITDALAPSASHVVAAYSLGAAQAIGLVLSGLVTALVAGTLITAVRMRPGAHDPAHAWLTSTGHAPAPERVRPSSLAWATTAAFVVIALGIGTASLETMQRLAGAPDTLVLGHRGFSDGGVENTIAGLEAAAAAGADLVEIDVLQTRDEQFVVMHDPQLGRLAGSTASVPELTLDELTHITVRDRHGHEGRIPSLADYVKRANALEMPLLIEIKIHGSETPNHVAQLIAELDALDALDRNIFHSLDAASVREFKLLRPDSTIGYILAFAALEAPHTPADFIVVEAWSATEQMQRSAADAGLGFMAWTVNDTAGIREHLRRNTDGIITDHPDVALTLRAEMREETGLADVLVDAITRFVTVV